MADKLIPTAGAVGALIVQMLFLCACETSDSPFLFLPERMGAHRLDQALFVSIRLDLAQIGFIGERADTGQLGFPAHLKKDLQPLINACTIGSSIVNPVTSRYIVDVIPFLFLEIHPSP
jgi:hypothetical protein